MGRKSTLQIGDTFVTAIGEYYTYLGYFIGKPHSYYNDNDQGYLYVFIGHKLISSVQELEREIDFRGRCELDGHFCYTKNPKRFASKLGNIPIRRRDFILGLKRIENKK